MIDYLKINKKAWDKRTETHLNSTFYDVNGFLNGATSLSCIELKELGNIKRKKVLHLQCHFGLDTLSLAKIGADVTGVDLSSRAIKEATNLAIITNLKANFICSDIYKFTENNSDLYDIVFTSYGALCWLPCLDKWAETVYDALKIGGKVHIIEFHPFNDFLSGYSYFHNINPYIEEEGTYTENCTGETSTVVTWAHPISEVINALIKVGIMIEHFNEYPFSPYDCFEGLKKREDGNFILSTSGQLTPLVYSIKAKKIK